VKAYYETFCPGSARQPESAYGKVQSNCYSDFEMMIGVGMSSDEPSDESSWYPVTTSIDDDDEYEDVVRCVYSYCFTTCLH
jgi:hypothetical protein